LLLSAEGRCSAPPGSLEPEGSLESEERLEPKEPPGKERGASHLPAVLVGASAIAEVASVAALDAAAVAGRNWQLEAM
jgi:hypothetical protein